jgi:hypothetical protein
MGSSIVFQNVRLFAKDRFGLQCALKNSFSPLFLHLLMDDSHLITQKNSFKTTHSPPGDLLDQKSALGSRLSFLEGKGTARGTHGDLMGVLHNWPRISNTTLGGPAPMLVPWVKISKSI